MCGGGAWCRSEINASVLWTDIVFMSARKVTRRVIKERPMHCVWLSVPSRSLRSSEGERHSLPIAFKGYIKAFLVRVDKGLHCKRWLLFGIVLALFWHCIATCTMIYFHGFTEVCWRSVSCAAVAVSLSVQSLVNIKAQTCNAHCTHDSYMSAWKSFI